MNSRKPIAGHKRASVIYGVTVTCECGWTSCNWMGKGASRNAHGEWRGHLEKCQSEGDAR